MINISIGNKVPHKRVHWKHIWYVLCCVHLIQGSVSTKEHRLKVKTFVLNSGLVCGLRLNGFHNADNSKICLQVLGLELSLPWSRHGFATAAPVEWNRLPLDVRSQQTILIFRSQLKTYWFRQAYPPS